MDAIRNPFFCHIFHTFDIRYFNFLLFLLSIVLYYTQMHVSIQSSDRTRKTIGHNIMPDRFENSLLPTQRNVKQKCKFKNPVNSTPKQQTICIFRMEVISVTFLSFTLYVLFFSSCLIFYFIVSCLTGYVWAWKSNSNQLIQHFRWENMKALKNCAHQEQLEEGKEWK